VTRTHHGRTPARPGGVVPTVFTHRQIMVDPVRADDRHAAGPPWTRPSCPPHCRPSSGDLGGLQHLSWVVTAYLLASTASTPLYGKISTSTDASRYSASHHRVPHRLRAGRHVDPDVGAHRRPRLQGLGAGGLMALAFAIIGRRHPARERGATRATSGPCRDLLRWPVRCSAASSWSTCPGTGSSSSNIPLGPGALLVTDRALHGLNTSARAQHRLPRRRAPDDRGEQPAARPGPRP